MRESRNTAVGSGKLAIFLLLLLTEKGGTGPGGITPPDHHQDNKGTFPETFVTDG